MEFLCGEKAVGVHENRHPVGVPRADGKSLLTSAGSDELVVLRSRFIAYAQSLESSDDLRPWLEDIRRRHPDARHVPYAWRGPSTETRTNDDGEPPGSAGRRCLEALTAAQLYRAGVAVARIFGGKRLGIRNLGIAYRTVAGKAITASGIHPAVVGRTVRCIVPFASLHSAEQALAVVSGTAERTFTSDTAILSAWMEIASIEIFRQRIALVPGARWEAGPEEWR